MKKLENLKVEDMIFIDIETVRSEKELTPESQCYEAWKYKARYTTDAASKVGDVLTPEEFYYQKAALYAPFSKIACITIGRIVDHENAKLFSYYGYNEHELLLKFNNHMNTFYEKNNNVYFVGFNIKQFDIPFINKRLIVNGIKPTILVDKGDSKPWELKDIDLSDLWKGSSIYADSLLAVAQALGLASPKVDMNGSETSEYYYNIENGIMNIGKYCEKDVETNINIYNKFAMKPIINNFTSNLK